MCRPFLIIIGIFLFLMSCSGKDNGTGELKNGSEVITTSEEISRVEMSCSSGDCPEFVGTLLTHHIGSVNHCSGTLIDRQYFLTNSHCLEGKEIGEGCENTTVHFLDKDNKVHEFNCAEVILVNKLEEEPIKNTNDYAIIKLEKPVDEIESYNSKKLEKLEDQAQVSIYTSNFIAVFGDTIQVEIDPLECNYLEESYISRGATSHYYPMMSLKHCSIVAGNSGSAIWGPNGGLAGVVYAGPKDQERDGSLKNHGLGVSAWCFNEERAGLFSDALCEGKGHDYEGQRFESLVELDNKINESGLSKKVRSLNELDEWIQYGQDGQPECIKKTKLMLRGKAYRFKAEWEESDFVFNYNTLDYEVDHTNTSPKSKHYFIMINKNLFSSTYKVYIDESRNGFSMTVGKFYYDEKYELKKCK
jgi:V8-like Glu-specific endopeptidase